MRRLARAIVVVTTAALGFTGLVVLPAAEADEQRPPADLAADAVATAAGACDELDPRHRRPLRGARRAPGRGDRGPRASMAPDAPIVLLDADTGERHPYWAELDEHPVTLEEGHDRTLIVRPLVNFREGHRCIVSLRDLRDEAGNELAASPAFTALRDAYAPALLPSGKPQRPKLPAPADIDPADGGARPSRTTRSSATPSTWSTRSRW